MNARFLAAALLVSAISATVAHGADKATISGSYRLVKRVLPDGTTLVPPAVVGFQTFGEGYRNFNVKWTQPDGTPVSLTVLATYDLTPAKYCEHPLLWVQNNLNGPGVSYQWPAEKEECSDVRADGGKLTFQIKGEPVVATFDANSMTAVAAGMFTDVWERLR